MNKFVLVVVFCAICFCIKAVSAQELKAVKLGANFALSGKLAFFGEAQAQSAKIAVDEINAAGGIEGHKVELIIEDNMSEAAKAATAAHKMLDIDDVDVMFSAFTHITGAISNLVVQKGKILIYASTVAKFAEENPLVFKDYTDNRVAVEPLIKAVAKKGFKRIGFVTEVSEACDDIEAITKEEVKKYGISIIRREEYLPGESDFRPLLLRIRQFKPDAIVGSIWRDNYQFTKQMKEVGMIKLPTFQWTAPFLPINDTPEARALYEENGTVSNWSASIDPTATSAKMTFESTFKAKYGFKPRFESVFIYDDIKALAEAARGCFENDRLNTKCVAHNYQKTTYSGAAGELRFSEKRVSVRKIPLIIVKNGEWVEYQFE